MTVIRNDSPQHIDRSNRVAVRESLNVIEVDPREAVLTEEDKKQEEKNRQVLEKVKVFENEYSQRKEQFAQEREERAKKNALAYEKKFGSAKHISEIEIGNYSYPGEYESLKVKAGLFSESVKTEYDFYLGYSKLQNVAKRQLKIESSTDGEKKETSDTRSSAPNGRAPARSDESRRSVKYDVNDSVSRKLEEIDRQNPDLFEYRNEEEAGKVRQRIHGDLKRYKARFTTEAILTAVTLILCLFSSKFSVGGGENANGASVRFFAVINFIIYTFSLYNVRSIVTHGIKSLVKLKANRDTSIACSGILACPVPKTRSDAVFGDHYADLLGKYIRTLSQCGEDQHEFQVRVGFFTEIYRKIFPRSKNACNAAERNEKRKIRACLPEENSIPESFYQAVKNARSGRGACKEICSSHACVYGAYDDNLRCAVA